MREQRSKLASEIKKGDCVVERDGLILDVVESRLSASGALMFFTLNSHGMTGLIKTSVRATKRVRIA